jgi:hypothetical protein
MLSDPPLTIQAVIAALRQRIVVIFAMQIVVVGYRQARRPFAKRSRPRCFVERVVAAKPARKCY